jgi:ribokinase
MNTSIVVVGSSNTDMCIKTPRLPRPGETVIGGEFFMAPGGKGANQAVAAARAGGRVTFVGCVGEDMFGRRAMEGFKADGIDVEYMVRDPESSSGVALIFVDGKGENSIAVASGANARLLPAHIERARGAIESAAVLLVQLETPLATVRAAAAMASKRGVRVILNPAPAGPLDDDLLTLVSVITPNETEAELLTGIHISSDADAEGAAGALLARGAGEALITMGARGVFVASRGERRMVQGFPVTAVDTTAAGDVFNGALAVALAEGKPAPDAACFANAAAAISVTKFGAQPSAPRRAEIDEFLGTRVGKKNSVA